MDVILEIKAGEGGEKESACLRPGAHARGRYAEAHGWSVTELSATLWSSAVSRTSRLRSARRARPPRCEGVVITSSGRRPTACSVPVAGPRDASTRGRRRGLPSCRRSRTTTNRHRPGDLRIDTIYRSAGSSQSRQHVRLCRAYHHLPRASSCRCRMRKSQLQNKETDLHASSPLTTAAEAR